MLTKARKTTPTPPADKLPNLDLQQFPAFAAACEKLDSMRDELASLNRREAELREIVALTPEVERLRALKLAHENERKATEAAGVKAAARHAAEPKAKKRAAIFAECAQLEKKKRTLDSAIRSTNELIRAEMAKPRMSVAALRYVDPARAAAIESAETELAAIAPKRGALAEAMRIVDQTADTARQSALRQLRGELSPEHHRLHADLADALRRLHEAGDALATFERTASGAGVELASKLPGRWADFREKSREWLAGVSQVWSTATHQNHW